jgi:conjugative transfer signal peptidase TraF
MIRRALRTLAPPIAALALLGGAGAAAPRLALVNESPSLPKGLYVRSFAAAPEDGAVVAIPQPPTARPYLSGLGVPRETKLLKRVAASGGAEVCAKPKAVLVGSHPLPTATIDRRGTRLPHWSGCRRLAPEELFLVGDTVTSFDSRYFGPVHRSQVEGVYREILTW